MEAFFVVFALIFAWSLGRIIPKASGTIGCLSLLILSPLILTLAFKIFSYSLARDRIPDEFTVGYLVWGEAGDPCGLVSYAINPMVASEIVKRGLGFFPDTMTARDIRWSSWSETPLRLQGQDSALPWHPDDRLLDKTVERSLANPGSFYSRYDEGILIVNSAEKRIFYGYCFA
jgi:hypothetical protein